jgi:hypothetical protein
MPRPRQADLHQCSARRVGRAEIIRGRLGTPLDNGVSRDMVLDYSEFAINAKLDEIEALPKPSC